MSASPLPGKGSRGPRGASRKKAVLVVGSVALDSVKTPFGEVTDVLGGSAVYFAIASSYFTRVQMVAVVGEDFPEEHTHLLMHRGIDLEGVRGAPGKTFRWRGEYSYQLNEAKTRETHLNVFEQFHPEIPPSYKRSPLVFLANIDPELQWEVLQQVEDPELVVSDTMNFWIEGKRKALLKTLTAVNMLIINDGEVRELSGEFNLVKAARVIHSYGPKILIVKRGEYGALMFNGSRTFSVPAYPLETVFDPTGAGDSFAGGIMGYLAQMGRYNDRFIRQAIIFGSVVASFTVEAFSVEGIRSLQQKDIMKRYHAFRRLTHFG